MQAPAPAAAPRSPSAAATEPSPKLAAIKQQMVSTAETYLGLMAADVVRRIERAGDEAQLLNVLGHWHMAMRDSKRGRDVAEACLERIKASFRDEDAALTG